MTQTEQYPHLQPKSFYDNISDLFIKYLVSIEHPEDLQHKLLQGFYINHKKEREMEALNEDEEAALSRSWGTPYDLRNGVFIRRMKARFTPQLLVWLNSQIMGNNLAADTYLTLLGIEFYKTHKFGEAVSLKWLDDIEVRGKLPASEALYKFSRAMVVGKKGIPISPSGSNLDIQEMYYWDVMKRADLYVCK